MSKPVARARSLLACGLGLAVLGLLLAELAHGFHHAAPLAAPARPSSFLPSATASRLPLTTTTTTTGRSSSPLHWVLHAEGGGSGSSSSAAAGGGGAPASSTARLCRNCKQYYEPAENHDRACRYHTKSYTGDTKRKGDWSANADRFENERQWWCCGEPSVDAPGCKYDRHRSYDDE